MKYSVRAFNGGTFWVPGPEVYWMEAWNQREEMNARIYLVQGGGQNILINTANNTNIQMQVNATIDLTGYAGFQTNQLNTTLNNFMGMAIDAATIGAITR